MDLKRMSTSSALNENGPNGVIHLNALLSVGGIAWKRLGGKALLEGVSWGLVLGGFKSLPYAQSCCLFLSDT